MSPEALDQKMEALQVALRRAGIRQTPQRFAIYREVLLRDDHPDAEAIHRAVSQRVRVSLDTVYRTLWTLTDLGLLATLGPRQPRARFDANLEPHHHFVCVRCGEAFDFESPMLATLPVPAEAARFGTALGTHVEVRGLCHDCEHARGEAAHTPELC